MTKESLVGLGVFTAVLIIAWQSFGLLRRKHPKKDSKEKRKITFRPVTVGTMFQNKPPRNGEHFDQVATELGKKNPKDVGVRFEKIPDIHSEAAFLVKNVLSPEECNFVMEAAEQTGYEQRQFQGDGTDSSSCVTWSPKLANAIYERMKNFVVKRSYYDSGKGISLQELDFDNQDPSHFGNADCINSNIRVEKYNPSQHLKIHRDGCVLVPGLQKNEHVYTIYAVLVYLNDNFTGGPTRFVNRKTQDEHLYDFIDVKGCVGDALVFRHEVLHSGGVVENGVKQVLRMDVAYRMEE